MHADAPAPTDATRRRLRWEAAAATLEATTEERRRFDHRANMARLIGVYVGDEVVPGAGSEAEMLLAMQPDQGGRKLLFLDPNGGQQLGFLELETLDASAKHAAHAQLTPVADEAAHGVPPPTTSVLRGMLVAEDCRGKGYARLFLAMWLGLCANAGVTPATSRINKPLLALTLVRLGFTPMRGRDKPGLRGKPGRSRKPKHRPLAVEVSVGSEGDVLLYCPLPTGRALLRAGLTPTELRSQRLVVANEPPLPRGRVAHIRVRYAPPSYAAAAARHSREARSAHARATAEPAGAHIVHAPLVDAAIGGRLRLGALQGPLSVQTSADRVEALRVLTGRLEQSWV